ncbi:MAG: D-glycero-beta-D-manno-heptose 1-phosphate adenylyltransferase [Crocinitomicaceae bacterium]|nr:D-glycero-beta-D-manno-heptose 1-phosphate adenylyltransferase [Crocinitomicaceae bacterium]
MTNLQLLQQKILPLNSLEKVIAGLRKQDAKVVFTNGCFDILHRGHLEYLAAASDEGDILVVGLNSDDSVKRQNKGPERPINNENSRAFILAGLAVVDFVVVFDEDTPYNLIESLVPDVLVKGGDYSVEVRDENSKQYIVGSDIVLANHGIVKTIDLVDGFSTTNIINKIKE